MANAAARYSMSMVVQLDPQQAAGSHPRAMQIPSPLHSASVHISALAEVDSSNINPQPWGPEGRRARGSSTIKETLNQDYLSPMKLVQITQEPDLSRVTYLELSINTTESSVGNFGAHLPNLGQLRFVESSVPCVRDLGTSLSSLKILWMSRCKLRDLDGLPALQNLQEFYLSFNHVEDISVITMLPALDVLDLESNNLKDEDQLGYLALCPTLRTLTLEGNPLSIMIAESEGGESGYRATIHEMVPNIKVLDDVTLLQEEAEEGYDGTVVAGSDGASVNTESLNSHSSLFALSEAGLEKDWRILQQSIKQGGHVVEHAGAGMCVSPVARPMTAPAHRPLSISPSPPPVSTAMVDESSELTHGLNQVICGNPVRALRARKQQGLRSQSVLATGSSYVPTYPNNPTEQHDEQLTLSSISEDLSVTRVKSEEKLFLEIQQPDHLSTTSDMLYMGTHTSHQSTSTNLQRPTHLTPTPPDPLQQPTPLTPTPPGTPYDHLNQQPGPRQLPTPPTASDPPPPRPKSVADFRHRRYRKLSTDFPRSFTGASTRT